MNRFPLSAPVPSISIFPVAAGIAVAVFFALVAIVGIFVIIVVASRAEPDPSGRRPRAVYLFGVSFFSVFGLLFGTEAIVSALVQLIGSHDIGATDALHPVGDAVARAVVLAGLVAVAALVLLLTHLRRGLALPDRTGDSSGPIWRVLHSYVAAVSFVAILIAASAAVVAVYELIRMIAPGVFALGGSRVDALRVVLSTAYLSLASLGLLWSHRRMLPGGVLGVVPPSDALP